MYLPRECLFSALQATLTSDTYGGERESQRGGTEGGKQRGGSPAPCNDFGLSDGLRRELGVEVIHECLEFLRRGSILLNHALEQKFKGARGG